MARSDSQPGMQMLIVRDNMFELSEEEIEFLQQHQGTPLIVPSERYSGYLKGLKGINGVNAFKAAA